MSLFDPESAKVLLEELKMTDTIAVLSTPPGSGGIAIIRISGEEAFFYADKLFKGKEKVINQKTHTVQYGKVVSPQDHLAVDEVLLTKMAAPRSYTREDIVEISCHGGYVVTRKILSLLFGLGVRPAEPGEFTKRAFLNGRMDLSQAEAVMDLIQARTDEVQKVAVRQLEGALSHKLDVMREALIDLLARIEVNLDYPEYDAEEVTLKKAEKEIDQMIVNLEALLNSFHYGKILREGMEVAIIGRPNAGKSSLLNRLAGKNRAIVTDIPGTTRDVLEEFVNIKGLPVKLFDTAGVRETADTIEKMGVEKSWEAVQNADCILYLLDGSKTYEEQDQLLYKEIRNKGKKVFVLVNKTDLMEDEQKQSFSALLPEETLFISVARGHGVDVLEEKLLTFAKQNAGQSENDVLLTNARHEGHIRTALDLLKSALKAVSGGLTLDMAAMDIKAGLEELGKITGHHASEDVLHAIFSKFCLGK